MKGRIIGVLVLLSLAGLVFAGAVADRKTKALVVGTGSATWTNTAKYAAIDLKRITIDKSLVATNYVTVYRVTSDNTYTGTIGTVTIAASKGTQTTLAYNYLLFGDKLVFDSAINTGSTAIIEYEQQEH
jgi:hypothetical protein